MLTTLKNDEISFISGSWVCDNTYKGKSFYKAVWNMYIPDDSKSYGRCYYGNDKNSLVAIPALNTLTGIVQKPINLWFFNGGDGGFSLYVCRENANECIFR